MKVLHLSSERTWRGGEQQIAYLIDELKAHGVDCHILCREESAFSGYCKKRKWIFKEAGFKNSTDLTTAFKIKNYCNTHQVDIVHMHGSGSHSVGVLSSVFGNKAKLILSRRVDFPLKTNFLSQWKYNHSAIKRILCVSDKIAEIVKAGISNPDICQTVYSGIDLSKFKQSSKSNVLKKRFELDDKVKLIGNTSALADHKDYFTFVDTAEEIMKIKENLHFVIFGTGPEEEGIKKYVKERGLDSKITFVGFVDNIPELLPELDVFLMTSKTEGLGTSLLDAMAAGVPIVATAAGGIPELVHHEETGLMADIKGFQTLASYVIQLLDDEELKNRIVTNSFRLVQKFDKKNTASQTLEVYKEVIADV